MHIQFKKASRQFVQEQNVLHTMAMTQIKKKIEILATFLPDEILKLQNDELNQIHNFVGILLFADVSGFTPLTEKYNKIGKGGIYRLTATLNAYIGALVEVIQFFGGDILKFSGDAFLALWKVMPDDPLSDILHGVVVCALSIQKCLGKFDTEVNVQLKVKLAISCGNMSFSVIGDNNYKYYLILGDAVENVKKAEHNCVSGDVVISPATWAHMILERYDVTQVPDGHIKVWKIHYKPTETATKIFYDDKQAEALKLIDMHLEHRNELNSDKKYLSVGKDRNIHQKFINSLPQRASVKIIPKLWTIDQLRPFIIKPVQEQVDESQPVEYLTEMREVTVQFINIIPISFDDPGIIDLLNEVYQIVCHIVEKVLGIVNKFSAFDKDAMLLVIFGLRGVKHEMEAQNALRSAFKIRKVISELKGIEVASVGITSGFVYCGVVGHPLRREYTVIGGTVNKAARIMCAYPGKVTCDHKTFKNSKLSSFYFKLQSALQLKGIEVAGYIFEYNEDFELKLKEQNIVLPTVGRSREYNYIRAMISDNAKIGNYVGVCLHGTTKIGKTEVLRYSLKAHRITNAYIIASIALEGSANIPYFCLTHLYRQIYDQRGSIDRHSLSKISNIPRDLLDPEEMLEIESEDLAMCKYRIINYFRDLTSLTDNVPILIFIDNVDQIDMQSWEILEIVLKNGNIRLIMAASFEQKSVGWEYKDKISINEQIKLIEMGPVKNKYIPTIACQFLSIAAIPKTLASLLIRSCDGRPGYIQCSLLRLMNNGSIEMKLVNKRDANTQTYSFPSEMLTGHFLTDIVPIVDFSEKYQRTNTNITLNAISLDLFDSFTPYQQLVIKTGAVMGDLFSRTLLMVALKYPPDNIIGKVIKYLFEEEVLDCGSRYIYASDLDVTKICCQCYFDKEQQFSENLPRYAYCKILHFKNKSIRDVAYDLLPGNQRKELHLLCTDVLARLNHKCPKCLRDPANAFLNLTQYSDIVRFCDNPDTSYYSGTNEFGSYDIKRTIRAGMFMYNKTDDISTDYYSRKSRSVFDPLTCNCFEIFIRVNKDIIYHSQKANHLGKRIFFTYHYGYLMSLRMDFINAVVFLSEAREMCMVNSKGQNTYISDEFKRIMIGRIEMSLANVAIDLRKYKAAKNHLAIALRQYNIPTVSLTYKHYNKLLNRSFLVNYKGIKPIIYKNNLMRHDLALCMIKCARLFANEGNWKFAKFAAAHSFFLFQRGNANLTVLMEVYCSAIDIYRYFKDKHMYARLQECAIKEIQKNYSNNITFNMLQLNELLRQFFEVKCVEGYIPDAIRMGYRVFDISSKIFPTFINPRLAMWMCLLLIFNFRIRDCLDLLNCVGSSLKRSQAIFIYIISMQIYVHCGLIYEPIDTILKFAEENLKNKPKQTWVELRLSSLIHLHFLRLGRYQQADEWKYQTSFNATVVRRDFVFATLLTTVECKILSYLRNLRLQNLNVTMEAKVIANFFKFIKEQVEASYPIYAPAYFILNAWLNKIKNNNKQAIKNLNKAYNWAAKNDNIYYKCMVIKMRNSLSGSYIPPYSERPSVEMSEGVNLTETEWMEFLHSYPLT